MLKVRFKGISGTRNGEIIVFEGLDEKMRFWKYMAFELRNDQIDPSILWSKSFIKLDQAYKRLIRRYEKAKAR